MNLPSYLMSEEELIEWVWENNYDYYAQLVVESEDFFNQWSYYSVKEYFDEAVYNVIVDEIRHSEQYKDYILGDDDE